jgi:putative nucleotidyltransferase with HDIG domain
MQMNYSFPVFIFAFFSAAVSTFSTYSVTKRSDLIFSGYIVGLFNGVFIISYGLTTGITSPLWYAYNALLGFGAGVLASMISLSLIPYLETLFKITTNHTLLELSNLNHPLLKRLMATAPGTYQHSLMVASLAEAAGEKLKANSVLCRVGSYFHDIGKMKRPLFFTENQFGSENPHDSLSDINSKAIIEAHVDDGIALAKKHKLPKDIIDIIAQHHGTSKISIFIDPNTNQPYRYKGPKPTSKEATIIMLADVVEATIRAKNDHKIDSITKTIDSLFKEKIQDGQCDHSPLTLKEIDVIKETFLNIFKTMHHQRLDYTSVEAEPLDD